MIRDTHTKSFFDDPKVPFSPLFGRLTSHTAKNGFLAVFIQSLGGLEGSLNPFFDFKKAKTHLNRPKMTQKHLSYDPGHSYKTYF